MDKGYRPERLTLRVGLDLALCAAATRSLRRNYAKTTSKQQRGSSDDRKREIGSSCWEPTCPHNGDTSVKCARLTIKSDSLQLHRVIARREVGGNHEIRREISVAIDCRSAKAGWR